MKIESLHIQLEFLKLKAHLLDGYEDAITSWKREAGRPGWAQVTYSYARMVRVNMERDGMEYGEAREWVDYNPVRIVEYYIEKPGNPVIFFNI